MTQKYPNPDSMLDRWEFIENHLSDYHSDNGVAWSNDLAKYIAGEFDYFDPDDRDRINEIAEICPTMLDAQLELERIDCELYLEALKHYRQKCSQTNKQA